MFDSRYQASDYAKRQGWFVAQTTMDPVAFDTATNTFWHLRRRGGFVFEPYFVWEQER
jgi:hypothetical protein